MNLFKKIFMLSMVIALIGSCKRSSEQEKPQDKPDHGRPYRGSPEETITLRRAHELYTSYQGRFDALTQHRNGREDARYGWHSLDFFKDYIAYLEHESRKVNMKVSGIRLYYAAYPEGNTPQSDFQTYIFVPTYYNRNTQKHIAFDPLYMDDNGNPIPIHDIITEGTGLRKTDKSSFSNFLLVQDRDGKSSVANMAEMCEPNCPEKN